MFVLMSTGQRCELRGSKASDGSERLRVGGFSVPAFREVPGALRLFFSRASVDITKYEPFYTSNQNTKRMYYIVTRSAFF